MSTDQGRARKGRNATSARTTPTVDHTDTTGKEPTMTLTETRALTTQAQEHCDAAEQAAESAMETTEIGVARLRLAEAAHHAAQADEVASAAHQAATFAIQTGARGGTLCSSKEEWQIALYTARAAAEAKLHMIVAGEAVQALTEGESYYTV